MSRWGLYIQIENITWKYGKIGSKTGEIFNAGYPGTTLDSSTNQFVLYKMLPNYLNLNKKMIISQQIAEIYFTLFTRTDPSVTDGTEELRLSINVIGGQKSTEGLILIFFDSNKTLF
jgi:hypothetical protein